MDGEKASALEKVLFWSRPYFDQYFYHIGQDKFLGFFHIKSEIGENIGLRHVYVGHAGALLWAVGHRQSSPAAAAKAASAPHPPLLLPGSLPCPFASHYLLPSKRKIQGVNQTWGGCKESSNHRVRVPVFLRKNVSFGFSAHQKLDKNVLNLESWTQGIPNLPGFTSNRKADVSFRIAGTKKVCVHLHLTAQSLEAWCCYKLVGHKSEVTPPQSAELQAPESRRGGWGERGLCVPSGQHGPAGPLRTTPCFSKMNRVSK